ncbi:hypothetical protein HLA87_02565 [Mycoplasma miroungigenitalium]|uniref:Metallo-beta-lactamase domain-containing protein n=1 Tax=Mycoplasma miroungigenitalium TaxID=754515 RepID=A0A6M4JC44_9MOLU|nr:MBL fold metallo-hydrolase [Mycoplasma miroungigenitalium]QJR43657.1 hypothetical protein HLA87_02565 [Mycoplasma miroungigenitalium]
MSKLFSYGSSSKGNCYLITFDDIFSTSIVLDAGINVLRNKQDSNRVAFQRCDYIFISHEHIDHSKYLKSFLDYCLSAKCVISSGAWNELKKQTPALKSNSHRVDIIDPQSDKVVSLANSPLIIKVLKVLHNSLGNNGYQIFNTETDTGVLYITDCGSFNPEQLDDYILQKTTLFMIESNHLANMPVIDFKTQVQTSDFGHFNNEQAIKLVNYIEERIGRDIKEQVVWLHTSPSEFEKLKQSDTFGKRLKSQGLECVEF